MAAPTLAPDVDDVAATTTDEPETPEPERGPWHVVRNRREMRSLGRRPSAGQGRVYRQTSATLRAAVRSIWDAK